MVKMGASGEKFAVLPKRRRREPKSTKIRNDGVKNNKLNFEEIENI